MARSAGGVLLLSFLAGPAGSSDILSPAYLSVLRRYAAGERASALTELASWPVVRLRSEIGSLDALRGQARVCLGCGAAEIWEDVPARAGLMLHADAALADWRAGRPARLQESAALAYAGMMRDDPRHADFVRRFFEATVAIHQLELRWGLALDWTERGLRAFPGSAALHLVVGTIEEVQGTLVAPAMIADVFVDPAARSLRARASADRDARQHFASARAALRKALVSDPSCVEARLRLGRLAWRLGEPQAARAEFQAVLAAEGQGDRAFLAHLFRGRLDEDAGRLDDAVASYTAALALLPQSHSAGVALSEARHRLGDLPGAREALPAARPGAATRGAGDPFSRYPYGSSEDAEVRLEALRRELTP